jgi:hypothetical protein
MSKLHGGRDFRTRLRVNFGFFAIRSPFNKLTSQLIHLNRPAYVIIHSYIGALLSVSSESVSDGVDYLQAVIEPAGEGFLKWKEVQRKKASVFRSLDREPFPGGGCRS